MRWRDDIGPDPVGIAAAAIVTALMIGAPVQAGAATSYQPVAFEQIDGWQDDAVGEAFGAFRRGCAAVSPEGGGSAAEAMRAACLAAIALPIQPDDGAARGFFETHFEPRRLIVLGDTGLFTGYFEPVLKASRTPSAEFPVPVLAAPAALVALSGGTARGSVPQGFSHGMMRDGALVAAPTRAEIEAGALAGETTAIVWLADPIDAFFLHVQGSGRLVYPDGTSERISYAGKNGHPYTSIGGVLADRGAMAREDVSMDSLRAWLAADAARGKALMEENRSYVFFRKTAIDDPALGPQGQLEVPLTPGRSLAVDRRHHGDNLPIWLDTLVPDSPVGPGGRMRRLMVAQDTGSAIRGPLRGDIFFGTGLAAGSVAGRMRAEGSMVVLFPRCAAC